MVEQIPILDLVPEKLRTGEIAEQYSEIRATREQNLARPDKLRRYATHESGHLIYLMRTGLITAPEDAIFRGPTIHYNGGIGYFMAAVTSERARLSDRTLAYTEELLDKLSLVAAAGTVFEKEIEGEDEETARASEGDENLLHKHCYRAMADFDIPFTGYTLWPCAKKRVTEYCKENRAELESKIEMARRIIFEKCFGLRGMPHLG